LKRNLTQALESWIAAGFRSIGQITITPQSNGGYELRHAEDFAREDLHLHTSVDDARVLSFFDDANVYRPLKTAPTLRHGWRLLAGSAGALRAALDHFYPSMTALWLSHLEGELRPVPLRETLSRQTGMYAATKRLLDDEGQELVGMACASSACTKRMLWPFSENQPLTQLPAEDLSCEPRVMADGSHQIPLLCHEACNILVAACREVVKKRERAQSPQPSAASPASH
jgi:sirohydrochlorin cobaltochelatase